MFLHVFEAQLRALHYYKQQSSLNYTQEEEKKKMKTKI